MLLSCCEFAYYCIARKLLHLTLKFIICNSHLDLWFTRYYNYEFKTCHFCIIRALIYMLSLFHCYSIIRCDLHWGSFVKCSRLLVGHISEIYVLWFVITAFGVDMHGLWLDFFLTSWGFDDGRIGSWECNINTYSECSSISIWQDNSDGHLYSEILSHRLLGLAAIRSCFVCYAWRFSIMSPHVIDFITYFSICFVLSWLHWLGVFLTIVGNNFVSSYHICVFRFVYDCWVFSNIWILNCDMHEKFGEPGCGCSKLMMWGRKIFMTSYLISPCYFNRHCHTCWLD